MSQRAKQHNRPLYGSAPGTGGAGAGPGPQTGPTHLHPVQGTDILCNFFAVVKRSFKNQDDPPKSIHFLYSKKNNDF